MKLKKQIAIALAELYAEYGSIDPELDMLVLEEEAMAQAAFLHDSYVTAQMRKLQDAIIDELTEMDVDFAEWIAAKQAERDDASN